MQDSDIVAVYTVHLSLPPLCQDSLYDSIVDLADTQARCMRERFSNIVFTLFYFLFCTVFIFLEQYQSGFWGHINSGTTHVNVFMITVGYFSAKVSCKNYFVSFLPSALHITSHKDQCFYYSLGFRMSLNSVCFCLYWFNGKSSIRHPPTQTVSHSTGNKKT